MKKFFSLVLLTACTLSYPAAQSPAKKKEILPGGKQNASYAGVTIPLGNFSETHLAGIILQYSRSDHRFGNMEKKIPGQIGFVYTAGLFYYPGRKENIVTTTYKYPAFTYLHLYGGLIWNPGKQAHITLSGGPALGLYNGLASFYTGLQLDGTYYISKRVGITPGLHLMKENKSDPLWSGSLKTSFIF